MGVELERFLQLLQLRRQCEVAREGVGLRGPTRRPVVFRARTNRLCQARLRTDLLVVLNFVEHLHTHKQVIAVGREGMR